MIAIYGTHVYQSNNPSPIPKTALATAQRRSQQFRMATKNSEKHHQDSSKTAAIFERAYFFIYLRSIVPILKIGVTEPYFDTPHIGNISKTGLQFRLCCVVSTWLDSHIKNSQERNREPPTRSEGILLIPVVLKFFLVRK